MSSYNLSISLYPTLVLSHNSNYCLPGLCLVSAYAEASIEEFLGDII